MSKIQFSSIQTSDKQQSTTGELVYLALNLEPDIEDVQDVLEQPTADEPYPAIYAIRRATRPPINIRLTTGLEQMAFVDLFPKGKNGFDETTRPTRISPLDYIQARLLGPDQRFQKNEFIFYWLSRVLMDLLKRSIAMSAKIGSI